MTAAGGAPILLVEDERATAALVMQLLAAERITNPIRLLHAGEDAIAYFGQVLGGELPPPVLCILDLSLPGLSGLDVLRHIRGTPRLAHLTVIVLTGSGSDADIDTAYELGIGAYLIKPAGVHGLPDVVRELHLAYELIPEPRGLERGGTEPRGLERGGTEPRGLERGGTEPGGNGGPVGDA